MLRIMEAAEFDRYIELAYELAMDPARSGYPTYCDGMKTKGDFVERTRSRWSALTRMCWCLRKMGLWRV